MSISPDSSSPPTWQRVRDVVQRLVAILALLGGIVFLLNLDHFLGGHANIPMAGEQLSYALLFVAGLFTGFHCVGMCGALVVGYTVKAAAQDGSKYFTHLYYGAGKTLSYTLVGAGFGALGAIITFTPFMRGLAGLGAGIFLLLFGLATLNLFPSLARFRIKTPAFVMRHLGKAYRSNSNPFVIGLLNGLMIICGPLQAMYIMAAGTGDPLEGGKLLFVFGLGTLPVMLGFGLLTSALSKQFAPKIVKASGVIVIGLGAIMLNRGLAMVGSGYDYHSLLARWQAGSEMQPAPSVGDTQDIQMMVQGEQYTPNQFVLRQGVPVRWNIHGQELTACNKRIVVPSLGMEFEVQPGHNQIQFTPKQAGVIPWSCSMGLIHGTFVVQEAAPTVQTIRMTANRDGYTPHQFTLRQGVPVRWIIAGEALGYGNHRLTVPALNLEFDLHPGENIIEFTPTQTGMIPWSGWMGDSQGVFLVHENTEPLAEPVVAMGHDHGHEHHGDSPPPRWMQDLLERSAEAVELLRDKLRP